MSIKWHQLSAVRSFWAVILTAVIVAAALIMPLVAPDKTPSKLLQLDDTGQATGLTVMSAPSDDTSGKASSNSSSLLQPAAKAPAPGGSTTTFPCTACADVSSATDAMICADYCQPSAPQPAPAP